MTSEELKNVVEQRMADPSVLGRIATNLRSSAIVEQRHNDGNSFNAEWLDEGDCWRCTITDKVSSKRLAQVDIHENGTVRADAFSPCRVTVAPEEGILCVTRY